jgi:hypothetical protein
MLITGERMRRSRDPANRAPRADDRFAPKQPSAATGPGVAKASPVAEACVVGMSSRRAARRAPGLTAVLPDGGEVGVSGFAALPVASRLQVVGR